MIVYTVLRHINEKIILLNSFFSQEEADDWAELQMKYLNKEWTYSISVWVMNNAMIIPCKDKRLKLVK